MATVDGLTLCTVVKELSDSITGGRIDKINQPDRDEISISVRSGGKNHRLLICVCADSCRIQLTETKKPNPQDAPMFCMLLRKHLCGGKITQVMQPSTDRIVCIEIESTDELYNTDKYYLVCELMGKHSNIILLDSTRTVIDAIKRVGISVSQARIVMPGVRYEEPPTEKKSDPLSASESDFYEVLKKSGRADRLISSHFYGMAPVVVMQMVQKAGVPEHTESMTDEEKRRLCRMIADCVRSAYTGESVYLAQCADKQIFLPFLPACPNYTSYDSPSQMLDEYYRERDKKEFMRRRSFALEHVLKHKLERAMSKLASFDKAIANEGDFDRLRIYGELITANMHMIRPGQRSVRVENYYMTPPETVEIALDVSLSAAKNAQRYYKLYKKAKGARDTALAMRESVLAEIEYLSGVEDCIKRAESPEDLDEIRAELQEQHYMRNEHKKGQKKQKKLPPHKFMSSDGYEIYVGRNNYQNDELTFRIASPHDIWLHVKDRAGSHTVIINKDGGTVPDSTLYEAAVLAAKNSSAGEGGAKVEVDYTFRRYVKKPAGALPGKVIYTNQKTILVVP
ncbi:MAG: NFACT family protein [Clostridia bacterium]|nr:NFACT family protein [Clostridia bacterium]